MIRCDACGRAITGAHPDAIVAHERAPAEGAIGNRYLCVSCDDTRRRQSVPVFLLIALQKNGTPS